MIILDTNVFSELFKQKPDPKLMAWFENQGGEKLYLTSIGVAETYYGLNAMPDGKRKRALNDAIEQTINEDFASAILTFGKPEALTYGQLAARLKSLDEPVGEADVMIAAIASVYKATLVTRNEKHFKNTEIDVVNPFLDFA